MKTNSSPKIFKFAFVAAISIALASTTQSLKGQAADNLLILTEHSPTSLTFTYNGSSDSMATGVMVSFVSPDRWTVTIAQGSGPSMILNWAEAESPSTWNDASGQVSMFGVFSDTSIFGAGIPVQADGHTFTNVGTDNNNHLPIDIQFFDEAARTEGSTVPDTGSTFGLLALALAGLFGARRLRSIRLA